MDEIRQLLSLVDKAEAKTCDAVKEIAETHLKEVQTRIADLQLIERTLLQLTVQCPGGTTQVCPIVESLQAS